MNEYFMKAWAKFITSHPEYRNLPMIVIAEHFYNFHESTIVDMSARIESLKKEVTLYRARNKGSETITGNQRIQLAAYERLLAQTSKAIGDITQAANTDQTALVRVGLANLQKKYDGLVVEPYNEAEELY
jgi:hypothetical protein